MFVSLAPVAKTHDIHNARRDFYLGKTGPVFKFWEKLNKENDIAYITSLCTVPMDNKADIDLAMLYIHTAGGYANYEMVEPFKIFATSVVTRANATITPPETKHDILTAFADNVANIINAGGNHRMIDPALDILLDLNEQPSLNAHIITVDTKEFTEAMRLWNNSRAENTAHYADAYGPSFISYL